PDLSFSEVNFLSTHREKPPESKRDLDNSKRRREHNAIANDDEISRFFTVAKAPLTEQDLKSYHNNDYGLPLPPICSPSRKLRRFAPATKSTMTPVEVPIRPFLGFGERGPHPSVSSGPSSSYRASLSPVKPLFRQNASIATSNFTWSTSPDYQKSSPFKRTVTDLFRSSRGKKDREKRRVPESPVLRQAEHRKTAGQHKRIQTTTANASIAISERLSDHQDGEEIDKLNVHEPADQSASSHNSVVIVPEPPNTIPEVKTSDFVQTSKATDLVDSHPLPSTNSVRNKERHIENTSTEEQNTQVQFAIAVQELLDRWKDKIEIPATFSNRLQESCMIPKLGMNIADPFSPPQPVPQTADIPQESSTDDQHQITKDANDKDVPIPSPITIVDDHCLVVPSEVIRPTSVVSRKSATKSQYSWTDPRMMRDRAFARSPFQDSTYGTCRGTESLYEQQLPRSAPISRRDRFMNGASEHLDSTSHFVGENGMSQAFEPLAVPARSQPVDENLVDRHDVGEPVFVPSLSSTPGNYWTSVERNWPCDLEVQHDPTRRLGPGDFYGDYEHAAASPQVPKQTFLSPRLSSATFESRSIRGCEDSLGSSKSASRGSQLNNECSTTQSLQSAAVEELPLGFWKPNKLY
ncbi:hypothetical protein MMC15_001995, partial [Xylographa vitiligo]|nr:hypothetical protein [Xylographa vitiligo]